MEAFLKAPVADWDSDEKREFEEALLHMARPYPSPAPQPDDAADDITVIDSAMEEEADDFEWTADITEETYNVDDERSHDTSEEKFLEDDGTNGGFGADVMEAWRDLKLGEERGGCMEPSPMAPGGVARNRASRKSLADVSPRPRSAPV